MNKDKWNKIWTEEVMSYENDFIRVDSPETYSLWKKRIGVLIKNMDEATEVYKMENKNGNKS